MDYKEKLRLAKEALDSGSYDKETIEYIFPELKESESEDERIRKSLIKSFTNQHPANFPTVDGFTREQIIAWLEKQGEQKPTEKVEPKFKVGDWITIDNPCQIISIDGTYIVQYCDDEETREISKKFCEFQFHIWTIQDARDGDVLVASDGSIFIFKEVVDCGCKHYIALTKDNETINVNDNLEHYWEAARGVKPATKKQRDLLFQKMKEAGYEWDAEKKETRKIEQKPVDNLKWNELTWEDINTLEEIINNVHYEFRNGIGEESFGKEVLERFRETKGEEYVDAYEQKSTWSEEDENYKNALISLINEIQNQPLTRLEDWDGYIDWLKSLKERYTWKPSDEQMQALSNAGNSFRPFEEGHKVLWSLYNDLKKLREE